jgi:hypothetical protein
MKEEGKPPYLPFSSFLTALDQLAQAVPTQIKKDVFPHHSGVLQGQLIGALRFLDLIDANGFPKGQKLEKLAVEKSIENRRINLRVLLKSSYADVLKRDLARMTPSQLDAAFAEYGISGDTKKKAKAFFIKAAKFTGLAVSPLLTRRNRSSAVMLKRKPNTALSNAESQEQHSAPFASKTIELKNGATLTVVLKGNFLDLDNEDRELLFRIMDNVKDRSNAHHE